VTFSALRANPTRVEMDASSPGQKPIRFAYCSVVRVIGGCTLSDHCPMRYSGPYASTSIQRRPRGLAPAWEASSYAWLWSGVRV
jgi:hypothetical protein